MHTHAPTPRTVSIAGSDYISLRQNMTFNPEDRLVPRCANITILEDNVFEGTESFSVNLLRTDSSLDITLASTRARVDIIDNDGTNLNIILISFLLPFFFLRALIVQSINQSINQSICPLNHLFEHAQVMSEHTIMLSCVILSVCYVVKLPAYIVSVSKVIQFNLGCELKWGKHFAFSVLETYSFKNFLLWIINCSG